MNKKPEPYSCVCLWRTEGDDPRPTDIEERFVLLLAKNEQQALEKAEALKSISHDFVNVDGYAMRNSVIEIVDVSPMIDADFTDGAELYSRYFSADRLADYRRFEPHLNKNHE